MASLKDVKTKIGGVAKTKQITKAMYMVASAKLRGAQFRIERFRPYAEKFQEILGDLSGKAGESGHPLLMARAGAKTTGIVLITSDRGLCGGYNVNLIAAALRLAADRRDQGKETLFYCLGRKGRDAVRKLGYPLALEVIGQMGAPDFSLANKVGLRLMEDYLGGALDEVFWSMAPLSVWPGSSPPPCPFCPLFPRRPLTEKSGPPPGNTLMNPRKPRCWRRCCPVSSRRRSIAAFWTPPLASTRPA